MEHGGEVRSDSTWALLEPLMPIFFALLLLVLLSFRAKPITNLRGGDIVVVHQGGPIARVKVGSFLNHGLSLEPKRNSVGGLGFIECIVHNIPSYNKGAWDVKHFKKFASMSLCN